MKTAYTQNTNAAERSRELQRMLKQMEKDGASLLNRTQAAVNFIEGQKKIPPPLRLHPSQTLRTNTLPKMTMRTHPNRMRSEADRSGPTSDQDAVTSGQDANRSGQKPAPSFFMR